MGDRIYDCRSADVPVSWPDQLTGESVSGACLESRGYLDLDTSKTDDAQIVYYVMRGPHSTLYR